MVLNMDHVARDFDRIAETDEGTRWNHNNHYHRLLLGLMPARRDDALEIGCGAGELLELLAGRFRRVTGIDFSPKMAAKAKERLRRLPNARVLPADARDRRYRAESLDFIVSVASFHHLPLRALLPPLGAALRPGGVLLILDLYRSRTLPDFLAAGAAAAVNFAADRLRNAGMPHSRAAREAWRAHGKRDRYPALADVRRVARALLPGSSVRRLLYWRYLLVYRKPRA